MDWLWLTIDFDCVVLVVDLGRVCVIFGFARWMLWFLPLIVAVVFSVYLWFYVVYLLLCFG